MSEIAEFTRHLGNYLPAPDVALVSRAFEFSASAHKGQFRKSGEPYITHPVAVATVLAELGPLGLAAYLALIGSIATYALLSLACAFSWDYASLLTLRTIQGFDGFSHVIWVGDGDDNGALVKDPLQKRRPTQ